MGCVLPCSTLCIFKEENLANRIQSPCLVGILAQNRARLNSLYAFARRRRVDFNEEAFITFFVYVLETLVQKLGAQPYPLLETMVLELYGKMLEFTAKGFLGSKGKYPYFEDCLVKLFTHFPRLVITHPADFTASFSNAIIHITAAVGGAVENWCRLLLTLPGAEMDLTGLKKAGLVAAWINGMAPYREQALVYSGELHCSLFCLLFGLDCKKCDASVKNRILGKMMANPWIKPQDLLEPAAVRTQPAMRTIGGFTGFGGAFMVPPEVFLAGGIPVAYNGDICYRIYADCFGCGLVRINSEAAINAMVDQKKMFDFTTPGKIVFREREYLLDARYALPVATAVCSDYTLCFTSPLSHKIFIAGITG